ncbi:polyadenylate-binding protein-interacting protein 1 isoform X3 [Gopherus flavomarginatus]|uniref:polyadenylate-binding protein-interacting protein 1 isoform X3 n=1 Tax=Gopherus flavomarginatus TaxID=286002 RepID=UPI0021CBF6BF|nr:polyadenylate-binding protein-interacting protein 1 isoform X3 [Gopherus flavomarginatus]
MSDCFDRAPGAGRGQGRGRGSGALLSGSGAAESGSGGARLAGSGFPSSGPAEPQHKPGLLQQQEPLRPPKTAPPGTGNAEHMLQTKVPPVSQDKIAAHDCGSAMAKPQLVVAPVATSKLSVNAPEFYPSGYNPSFTDSSFEDGCDSYPTLTEYVQDFLNHLTEQPGCFETEIEHFAETLNGCRTEYENRDQAAKGDEATRKRFHTFVLFLAELYLNLEIKGTKGQVMRAEILQTGLRELLNALFSNPVDNNLICAVKLLKLTGSVLEDAWKEKGKTDMDEMVQRIENVVLDANCSRDVKQMLLKLVELRSSNWGRVHVTSTYREATPENDPNYFMNEPTFYTSEGVPFTAADPDYQEKYQELLDREDFFPDYEENGTDLSGAGDPYFDDIDDEMDPEIEEAYEKFCLESERKRKQ